MPNHLSNDDWTYLVEHLREQIVKEGRVKPDFMRAQRATGIDRRTVKGHWERSIHGRPSIERLLKRQDDKPRGRPAPTQAPASPTPVGVPPSAPTVIDGPNAASTPPIPVALASGPVGPSVGEPPATQPAPAPAVALLSTGDPLEQLQAAAILAMKDEQALVEGHHLLGKGILSSATLVLKTLYDSIPDLCLDIQARIKQNPKEWVSLLRELTEISEKLSKTHGRNVETQRVIAGVPTSHTELTVRREGPVANPDADDERIEQKMQLKSLIRAEARRLARAEGYAAEAGDFVEVEATPVRREASAPDSMPVAEPAVPVSAAADPGPPAAG